MAIESKQIFISYSKPKWFFFIDILKIVFEKGIVSVSIPPISTDALGFPVTKAATTIIGTLINYIDANPNNLKGKTIVLWSLEEQAVRKN